TAAGRLAPPSENEKARAEARAFPYGEVLGQVVADVAENVLQLAAEEDHGDDDRDGDNSNDECVLDQTLAFVVTEECKHRWAPPFFLARQGHRPRPPRRSLGTPNQVASPPLELLLARTPR